MKIAVIGAGAAGLTSAWLLQADHDVVVFESGARPGGHARTLLVEDDAAQVPVELGAQFFFEDGYSGLRALIERLGLTPIRERVAASLTMGERTIVIPPLRASAVATCLSLETLRDLYWLGRFVRVGEEVVRHADWSVTVAGALERAGVPRDVGGAFLVPFIASSWGVPRDLAAELPLYTVMRVMNLGANKLPHALRLERGLSSYVERLVEDAPRCELRLGTPVLGVDDGTPPQADRGERAAAPGVRVHTDGRAERFDAVILACDWRNSAALCAATPRFSEWCRAFRAFDDYEVHIAVHRDPSLMPTNPEHWETTNFSLPRDLQPRTTVWSGKPQGARVFRSWMRRGEAEPRGTLHVERFRHVVVTTAHPSRQEAIARLQGSAGLWAVGMYTDGIDNHESALRSACSVARRLAPGSERVRWLSSRVSA